MNKPSWCSVNINLMNIAVNNKALRLVVITKIGNFLSKATNWKISTEPFGATVELMSHSKNRAGWYVKYPA